MSLTGVMEKKETVQQLDLSITVYQKDVMADGSTKGCRGSWAT